MPESQDVSNAVIVLWGSLHLEELDGNSRSAPEPDALSRQSLLVDHLGDVRQSLQLGLPVYRLKGGSGYLWSAASDRGGRGHLRFLTIDVAALAAPKVADVLTQKKVADVLTRKKEVTALTPTKDGAVLAAANDLRPFLALQPTSFLALQPTSIVPNDAGKLTPSEGKDKPQQSIVQKTRTDVDRERIMDAERMAADERSKARLAWARFEAEKAAYEASDRVKWTIAASLFILIAILALLRVMTREQKHTAPADARKIGRKAVEAALFSRVDRGYGFTSFASAMRKARAAVIPKSVLAGHS